MKRNYNKNCDGRENMDLCDYRIEIIIFRTRILMNKLLKLFKEKLL